MALVTDRPCVADATFELRVHKYTDHVHVEYWLGVGKANRRHLRTRCFTPEEWEEVVQWSISHASGLYDNYGVQIIVEEV